MTARNNNIASEDVASQERTPLGYPSRLMAPGQSLESVTEKIGSIVLKPRQRQPKAWFFAATGAFALLMMFFFAIAWLLYRGTGIWGINVPIAWGFAIVNFVWWVGIGHAGTFISAILLLLHQKWRTAINRFTETMTLCAISCAGMFPLIHLGRPWVFFWMAPYPDTMGLWPQFRSPLVWDMFAVGTYFIVSLIFWYCGLIPDLATIRDRATTRRRQLVYGILAMGWRN
ncbi:MAG TPA: NrfD/PsrC family molybdoenzyme membrane anchor subunit, partial [Verrucomicrobiae bacterium]|nr:NrfD/PsrC family molybdoenzyme membrane anchor subunit [Verrucomicrobiae bacterium]